MLTAEATAPVPAQIEKANFLNLLIGDDERSIREACREAGQILGFKTFVADSAEHLETPLRDLSGGLTDDSFGGTGDHRRRTRR